MTQAQDNNTVQVHYTGKLDDGSVFDSSQGRDPLQFVVGTGQVIKGFDAAVRGMEVGETKTVRIPAADAYGEPNEKAVLDVERTQLPQGVTPELGMQFNLQTQSGQQVPARITAITDTHVKLDANHPLAGKALTFELELVAIN
jgi:peptidylprolyl isomerase